MVQGRVENGKLVIALEGYIDSANAKSIEGEIQELCRQHPCESIELDCEGLKYSSSAGLRVILRLKQEVDDTVLTNVQPSMYDVLDMTGFTEMMEVQKAYRVISVENCEVIGQGANGKVYRIDPDTIVKVYLNPDALPEIHRERELARLAFVTGIPTAIPYDVVRIEGGGYGSVFELLDAVSFAKLLSSGKKTLEEVAKMSTDLLKLMHSKKISSDILPDMKKVAMGWMKDIEAYLPEEQCKKLQELVQDVPRVDRLIHGDFHVKNIMLQNDECLLIDMDTLSMGHPIFELASMYNAYVGYGLVHPEKQADFLGIPHELCTRLWRRSLELYLGTEDGEKITETEDKARVIGLARIMRREIRRDGLNREDGRELIEVCRAGLAELLPRIDSLVF